jgi:hypothetical protein
MENLGSAASTGKAVSQSLGQIGSVTHLLFWAIGSAFSFGRKTLSFK